MAPRRVAAALLALTAVLLGAAAALDGPAYVRLLGGSGALAAAGAAVQVRRDDGPAWWAAAGVATVGLALLVVGWWAGLPACGRSPGGAAAVAVTLVAVLATTGWRWLLPRP